jgi:hypothetical protein
MALDRKDREDFERIVYKNSDDIAISIARSFERLSAFDGCGSRLEPISITHSSSVVLGKETDVSPLKTT